MIQLTKDQAKQILDSLDFLEAENMKAEHHQDWEGQRKAFAVLDILRTAIAAPKAEPVAWMHEIDDYATVTTYQKENNEFQYSEKFLAGFTIPLYTAAPTIPALGAEPVAFRFNFDGYGWDYRDNGSGSSWQDMTKSYPDSELLYTAAPTIPAPRAEPSAPKCKDHPAAPHGFDRNASHNAHRYVCDCEGWQEPKAEPVAWLMVDDIGRQVVRTEQTVQTEPIDSIRYQWRASTALYTHPALTQEPIAEIVAEDMGKPFNAIQVRTHFYKQVPPVGTRLYAAPTIPAEKEQT
jgi:hypothetical protein